MLGPEHGVLWGAWGGGRNVTLTLPHGVPMKGTCIAISCITLAACGGAAAEHKAGIAKASAYNTDFATVWNAIAAEMHAGFAPLRRHCPMNMWRTVKARELPPEVAADVKRIEAILRAVLRAGAYELGHRNDVPARVVVSEYVDVANAFVDKDETGMVNAVLDQIARRFRGGEFTAR